MSLFSRTSPFDEEYEAERPPPVTQTVKRVIGRRMVEEPVQKFGKTIVATDDLEAWYRELEELARGPVIEEERTDALLDLRDSVYRYLR